MKTVFIDMDGVLADFDGQLARLRNLTERVPFERNPPEMFRPGFFRNLPVMKGATAWVYELLKLEREGKCRVYVATKHSSGNAYCAAEKLMWLEVHFPELLKRVLLVCDKALLKGDFLIDDDAHRWRGFGGKLIHFDPAAPLESWERAVETIRAEL